MLRQFEIVCCQAMLSHAVPCHVPDTLHALSSPQESREGDWGEAGGEEGVDQEFFD